MPTLNCAFENKPIVSGISTQPVAENNLLADEKDSWKEGSGSYLYIHLYYRSDLPFKSLVSTVYRYSNNGRLLC